MDPSQLRQSIIDQLRRDEGCVLHAYEDSRGYLTIGVGRLIDERRGGGITQAEADMLLSHDIGRVTAELDERLVWWRALNEPRQGVLVNMAFQLGVSGLLAFRRMLAAAQVEDYDEAAAEMLDSRWARQVKGRAIRLAKQMRMGEWA